MEEEINYIFSPEKNAWLSEHRGINFNDVIFHIKTGKILDIVPHHNKEDYPDQWIMILLVDNYVYQVPFRYEGSRIRLITVFPSRKYTKLLLGGEYNED